MSRAEVEANQRARIVDAVLEVVGERGYSRSSVRPVLALACVSRRTFYELFEDFDDAFAFAVTAQRERVLMLRSAGSLGEVVAREVELDPTRARACLVEVVAMPGGWQLREDLVGDVLTSREARGALHEVCGHLVAGDGTAAAEVIRMFGVPLLTAPEETARAA